MSALQRTTAAMAAALLVALAFTACGGAGDDEQSSTPGQSATNTQPSGEFSGVVLSSGLTTGPNRFSVGVLDGQGAPVNGADASFTFLKLTSASQGEVRSTADADPIELERFVLDEQTGAKTTTGSISVYVAQATFDETGDWAIQITGNTADGVSIGTVTLPFTVLPPDQVLNVGDPAPRSRQTIASDVSDISAIDSMIPHDQMHEITIADAVTSEKPTVILFGTPAYCETQVCGPVMQGVMLPLYDQYSEQANFIHVEPYFLEEVRSGRGLCAVPAFNIELARAGQAEGTGPCPNLADAQLAAAGESWNLTTEPIVFLVDSSGNIAGSFEGVTNVDEVKAALEPLL